MAHKKRTLSVIGVMISMLWVAACSPAVPTSAPTLNLNPLRTQVAGTVFAQVTRALALTPSITPLPSSTATIQPTLTPGLTASPMPSASLTLTSGTPQVGTVNLDQWVAQSIADDTVFSPGQTFTITWTLKNTGTATWTTGYLLRFYSGSAFGAPNEIAMSQAVPPGAQIDISIKMKAPTKPGTYLSTWVMSNQNRINFKQPVYVRILVALPLTPTPTPKS